MKQFIKVMATLKDEDGKILDQFAELINIDQLKKVVKWHSVAENEICFEWHDEVRQQEIHWVYDCGTAYKRDVLFEKYEKMLCGAVVG